MKEPIAFRNVPVNPGKISYITPVAEEIKIRFENNIMSQGGNEGFGEPDDD